jgi:translation initiation factor 1A
MPINTGGKRFKRAKSTATDAASQMIECGPDQMFARVIRMLGNCNVLAFCNDGKQRICHIRGKMRNRTRLNVGDLILISVRDFEKTQEEKPGHLEKGDVVAKYEQAIISQVKKVYKDIINPLLFATIENTADGKVVLNATNEDDIFDYDGTDNVKKCDEGDDATVSNTNNITNVSKNETDKAKYKPNYEHITEISDDFNIDDI